MFRQAALFPHGSRPVQAIMRSAYATSSSLQGKAPGGLKGNGIVAIRRETKNRWERRAPLDPSHVRTLVRKGTKVIVQPSDMRFFTNDEYEMAGALVQEDITPASLIVGVKEIPIDQIIPERTYMCFSHTIKAQDANMNLLDAMLNKKCRLIDYEVMVNEQGKRVIGFGKFAGNAGMIDIIRGIGDRLLGLGYSNPFLGSGYTDYFHSLSAARTALQLVGHSIRLNGVPRDFSPFIFAFTGSGNVTQGCLDVFKELPHEFIDASELQDVVRNGDRRVLYGCMLKREDLVAPKDPKAKFDKNHYSANPQLYRPVFHERVAPWITCLVNGMYWDARFPKLLTGPQMRDVAHNGGRLIAIADISADPYGSIEFTKVCTTIDRPFLVYNYDNDTEVHNWEAPGVLLGSVDNLPAQLPKEASNHFGSLLLPYIRALSLSDGTKPIEEQTDIPPTVQNAVLTSHGSLTPRFAYISKLRQEKAQASKKRTKQVLLCGSGLVVSPCIEYLLRDSKIDINLTIAGADVNAAQKLAKKYNCSASELDVSDAAALSRAVQNKDLVISLVPAAMHPMVAKACIAAGVNMVTTSYVSPDMEALHKNAANAGVTILNEIGLDPGIDHLSAMQTIDGVRDRKGKIDSFISYCGGLPAPEHSNNPLGYKFSWSPRGVLAAGLNPARWRENGKIKTIEKGHLFRNTQSVDVFPALNFEGLPNRDSLTYESLYGLESAHTMLRGTLRYKGFSEVMDALRQFGLFSEAHNRLLDGSVKFTWNELMKSVLNIDGESALASLPPHVAAKVKELGVFSNEHAEVQGTPIDTLCALLKRKLAYQTSERDMVILTHQFGITWENGRKELRRTTLYKLGEPGSHTAMAVTVGLPCAIAAEYMLLGKLTEKGVLRPTDRDLADYVLKGLEQHRVAFHEDVQVIN